MTNYYNVFYLLSVSDSLKNFFDITSNIFTVFAIASFIGYVIAYIGLADKVGSSQEEDEKDHNYRAWNMCRKYTGRIFYTALVLSMITWTVYVLTPSKKDCLMIIAGGAIGNFMTTDTAAKQLPSDITQFLHMTLKGEIKDLSEDAKRELGLQTPKDKLIDKVKDLTKEQLIDYLKNDTTIVH
jgi:hypothetical protein